MQKIISIVISQAEGMYLLKIMQKNLLLVTITTVFTFASYQIHAKELSTTPIMAYGEATSSCGSFVESKQNDSQRYIYLAWLNGYLTAINMHDGSRLYNGSRDIKAGRDPQALMLWLENYCHANPLDSFFQAVTKLQQELQK